MSPEIGPPSEIKYVAEDESSPDPDLNERFLKIESSPNIGKLRELQRSPDIKISAEDKTEDSKDDLRAKPDYQGAIELEYGLKGDPHFCTPLLVSSILAVAAVGNSRSSHSTMTNFDQTYSDYPKICAIRGIDSTRGQNFFEEAERLWKAERGRPTLANIQAVTLMSRLYAAYARVRFICAQTDDGKSAISGPTTSQLADAKTSCTTCQRHRTVPFPEKALGIRHAGQDPTCLCSCRLGTVHNELVRMSIPFCLTSLRRAGKCHSSAARPQILSLRGVTLTQRMITTKESCGVHTRVLRRMISKICQPNSVQLSTARSF